MKAYEIRSNFGMENLTQTDRPVPQTSPGQVLVKVKAVALNYRDLLVVDGKYNPKMPLPRIPCSDGVGEVVGVGDGVSRVKIGDRVAGTFFQGWISGPPTDELIQPALGGGLDGMLAEYVALDESGVVHVPPHLTDEEAACLPCAALTAWNGLFAQVPVKPGDNVLTLGTGGVSIFAIQFASLAGARVIATSSSDEKLQRVRSLGASETINYKTEPEWHKRVLELTGGLGVDLVVEVGGAGTLERSLRSVKVGGTLSMIGVLTQGSVNPMLILMKSARVQGIYVGSRSMFEDMNRAIDQHKLRPVVDRIFPFAESRAAYDYLRSGAHFGKVVIRVES